MIKAVDSADEICGFSEDNNVYLIKILSNMKAYSRAFGTQTWTQNNNGNHAVLQATDDSLIIFADDNADFEEISEFLPYCGCKSIFTSSKTAKKLHLSPIESGIILRQNHSPPKRYAKCAVVRQYYPDYSRIYSLLKSCGFTLPDRDSFAADLSLRMRRQTARVFCDTNINAVCIVGFETAKSAIISAVAVSHDMRLNGLGGSVLKAACSSLKNEQKQVYLYRETDKNEEFYSKNGFGEIGSFVNCKK